MVWGFLLWLYKTFIIYLIVLFINWHIRIIKKFYKNYDTKPEQRKIMKNAISFWSWTFLFMNGVLIKRKYPEYKEIYKKYLGEDYDFTDEKYSLITSNHLGFFEVVLCMALYAPGFMAKKDIQNYCFIGPISSGLNCFFVDRKSKKDKKIIFDLLLKRQQSFYNGTFLAPLVMFPEGTCSCGRNILRFKKGSFYSLLPLKPQIVSINQKKRYHLSVGASNVVLAYFKNLCHFFNTLYVAILPTIRPTDYMFENYKHFGKEKWEIYMNVVRKIYSKVGGMEEADMGFRDINRYIKAMRTGFYDPNENLDYESEKTDNNKNDMNSEGVELTVKGKYDKIEDAKEEKEEQKKQDDIDVKEKLMKKK